LVNILVKVTELVPREVNVEIILAYRDLLRGQLTAAASKLRTCLFWFYL
jgi:hypothetical protein